MSSGKRHFIENRWSWLVLSLLTVLVVMYSSCSDGEFNALRPIAEPLALKNDDKAKIEESRVLMDKGRYSESLKILGDQLSDPDTDTNEVRLLYAAAKLGEAGLDVWSIISSLINATNAEDMGLDALFDAISSSVLGTGAVRQQKVAALTTAIETMLDAPEPEEEKLRNTACIFAALLAMPAIADAKDSLRRILTVLGEMRAIAASGGSECSNTNVLTNSALSVAEGSRQLSLVLEAAAHCSFLDLNEAANMMNNVEDALSRLKANADKGCSSVPACPASMPDCHQLFPTCVEQSLGVGSAAAWADDGILSTCELILHCVDPEMCFKA